MSISSCGSMHAKMVARLLMFGAAVVVMVLCIVEVREKFRANRRIFWRELN